MTILRSLLNVGLVSVLTVYAAACMDTKGHDSGHRDSTTMSGASGLVAKSSGEMAQLAKETIRRVRNDSCGPRDLRRIMFEGVGKRGGVHYSQLYTMLQDLTDPASTACSGKSCAVPFGVPSYKVGEFLAASKRAADLLDGRRSEVQALRASFTPPSNGGVWNKPGFLGPKVVSDKGTIIVYTYQNRSDFVEKLGHELDLSRPQEARALAETLVLKKMRRAVEGNKGIRDVADLPNNAVQGYGLYASPDAMQTPEFGDVLIEFEIPLEAYYSLYDTLENSIKKIRGNQLGVVYPYRPSVSGDKAVVLRWDSSAHPLALPIIPGSVRVYPNTISGWRGDNLISTLDELRKKGANKSGNPARDFMDRYGHHLGLFYMTPATGKTDDQLKDILVHSFIKDQLAELKKRPKWVEDGLVRLRRAADSDPVINGLTYKSIYFNKEKIDDPRYFGDAMMIAFRDIMGDSLWNLPFLIRFAKAMEMVPEAFEPKSVPDLRREIVNQRVPAATRQSLEESLKQAQRDWVEVVEYWKKNNLDAFVERVSQ